MRGTSSFVVSPMDTTRLQQQTAAGLLFFGVFLDQATHNGTRPNSPVGVKPATTPSGSLFYGSIPGMGPTPEDLSVTRFGRWPSVSPVKKIVGCLMSSAGGMCVVLLISPSQCRAAGGGRSGIEATRHRIGAVTGAARLGPSCELRSSNLIRPRRALLRFSGRVNPLSLILSFNQCRVA